MGWLLGVDTQILYFINGLHCPFLDAVMWQLSKPLVSLPVYAYFIYLLYMGEGKNL